MGNLPLKQPAFKNDPRYGGRLDSETELWGSVLKISRKGSWSKAKATKVRRPRTMYPRRSGIQAEGGTTDADTPGITAGVLGRVPGLRLSIDKKILL